MIEINNHWHGGDCLKSSPPLPGASARVLLLKEEEKNNIMLFIPFTSLIRRGVMPEVS
jgi:hypothetical protein